VSHVPGTIALPLRTLGLSARVSGWLLDAGLPCAPLETAEIRRGIAPEGEDRAIVLFDSRNASARTDAEAAAALGYETIDAAKLLAPRPADDDPDLTLVAAADPRRRFFDALRPEVEAAGGLWLRVADFPHPFRWAVCDDADRFEQSDFFATALSAFGELPAGESDQIRRSGGRLSANDWLRACAAAGRPVRMTGDAADPARLASLPLTWNTTLAEFEAWWRFRRRLVLNAVRRGRTCEIELVIPYGLAGSFAPAVEIWRGRHHAVVPLRPGLTALRDEAIPYQINVTRHHAGFTADAADPDLAGAADRTAAFATA
jgi:hypothetical protein